jgi:hypothetical protein
MARPPIADVILRHRHASLGFMPSCAYHVDVSTGPMEPEERHRLCWYSRRTADLPAEFGFHVTIENGELLFCSHPMWFPIVGYEFDVRNCDTCEYFRPRVRSAGSAA